MPATCLLQKATWFISSLHPVLSELFPSQRCLPWHLFYLKYQILFEIASTQNTFYSLFLALFFSVTPTVSLCMFWVLPVSTQWNLNSIRIKVLLLFHSRHTSASRTVPGFNKYSIMNLTITVITKRISNIFPQKHMEEASVSHQRQGKVTGKSNYLQWDLKDNQMLTKKK